MCFPCGYCGNPTDKNGKNLSIDEIKNINTDFNNEKMTQGNCCAGEQEIYRMQVTQKMAIDCGSPEMEGMWI